MNMYNLEILDEEAFMKWKEEVNDLHPGKGQALFQVIIARVL
jgi:translation initiation factor 4G